jgi:hypothetical protein
VSGRSILVYRRHRQPPEAEKEKNFFVIFSTMIGTIEIPCMLSDPAVQERIRSGTRGLLLSSFLDALQDGLESELGSSVPDESLIHVEHSRLYDWRQEVSSPPVSWVPGLSTQTLRPVPAAIRPTESCTLTRTDKEAGPWLIENTGR